MQRSSNSPVVKNCFSSNLEFRAVKKKKKPCSEAPLIIQETFPWGDSTEITAVTEPILPKGFSYVYEQVRNVLNCFTCFSVLQPRVIQHLGSLITRRAAAHRGCLFQTSKAMPGCGISSSWPAHRAH